MQLKYIMVINTLFWYDCALNTIFGINIMAKKGKRIHIYWSIQIF
jgi:hypothetical protein